MKPTSSSTIDPAGPEIPRARDTVSLRRNPPIFWARHFYLWCFFASDQSSSKFPKFQKKPEGCIVALCLAPRASALREQGEGTLKASLFAGSTGPQLGLFLLEAEQAAACSLAAVAPASAASCHTFAKSVNELTSPLEAPGASKVSMTHLAKSC